MTALLTAELADGLDHIRASPADVGTLELIVARPSPGARIALSSGELDIEVGLVGDDWLVRGSRHTDDGTAELSKQVMVVSSRLVHLAAGGDPERGLLIGDQLHVDLDLSLANLPAGSRLTVGGATVEVTTDPHTGCAKFTQRFGLDAMRFVNSPVGKELRLRGLSARVITPGPIHTGDTITVERP